MQIFFSTKSLGPSAWIYVFSMSSIDDQTDPFDNDFIESKANRADSSAPFRIWISNQRSRDQFMAIDCEQMRVENLSILKIIL